jgi:hypothetical protein
MIAGPNPVGTAKDVTKEPSEFIRFFVFLLILNPNIGASTSYASQVRYMVIFHRTRTSTSASACAD